MEFEKLFPGSDRDAVGIHVWDTDGKLYVAEDGEDHGIELTSHGALALIGVLEDWLKDLEAGS